MRLLFFLLAAAIATPLSAQTFVFTAGAGEWTDGENWNNCIDPEIGPPCFSPSSTDHTAILPAGTVVTLDAPRFIGTLRVEGAATLTGTGSVGTDILEILPGKTFAIDAEVRADVINADATTEIGGTGRLRLTQDVAPVTALSVATVECANLLGETCDFTGATVTSSALWMTGGGLMLVDGSAAATLDALLIDARPLGPGGPVPGDITFTGAPAVFDLASIETVDSFGTVDFNGGSATVAAIDVSSFNTDGLRNLVDLTLTGSMDWKGGTIETTGTFTVASGARATSQGNNYIKGRMEVAGVLGWSNLFLTLGSQTSDPSPGRGDLVILPSGRFLAYNNRNSFSGNGALIVQGILRADARVGPFEYPDFDTVTVAPDSVAIDGGTVRVEGGRSS